MQYHLAEINIATFRVPIADPVNVDFIANLDRVNALAETAAGFVWRLKGEGNNALEIHAFDNPNTAINMSVWTDMAALADFVYRNEGHQEIMRRRKEWFDRMEFHLAMWWVPAGSRPTVVEGRERIESLSRIGPSAFAFLSTGRSRRRFPFLSTRDSTYVRNWQVRSLMSASASRRPLISQSGLSIPSVSACHLSTLRYTDPHLGLCANER